MKLLGRILILALIAVPVFAVCMVLLITYYDEDTAELFVDAVAAKLDSVFGG